VNIAVKRYTSKKDLPRVCDECLRAGWKLATGTTRLDETGYWPLWHVVCEGTSP
jgi:hypothetical protein